MTLQTNCSTMLSTGISPLCTSRRPAIRTGDIALTAANLLFEMRCVLPGVDYRN
ncbi:MAG: hypothetical protein WD044_11600 [Dongiaceae bacterium]